MNQKSLYIVSNNLKQQIQYFAKNMFAGEFTLNDADKHQSDLLVQIVEFHKDTKPRDIEKKAKNRYLWNLKCILWR